MAIKELDNGIFWMCYIFFIVAILFIPVYRNLYYIRKYKMSFSEHKRQTIGSFLENNTCIYVAEYSDFGGVMLVISMPLCIFMTVSVIKMGDTYSNSFLLLCIFVLIILHISCIDSYMEYLYSVFLMTNTSILIRGFCVGNVFKEVPLHDVVAYRPHSTGLGMSPNLDIMTKDGKLFQLRHLKNREQLIDVLKKFTNSTEEL